MDDDPKSLIRDLLSEMDAGNPSAEDEIIAGVKEVVASHERETTAGNLDGLVANAAEDIVVLAPGAPLVLGRDAFREFDGALLEAGSVEFKDEYAGSELVGDAVALHGVSRGTMTPTDGTPTPVENNFLLILKPDESGAMKLWRGASAPPSM